MPSFTRPIGASGAVLAVALLAAACGSGSTDTTASDVAETSSAESTESTTASPSTESTEQADAEPDQAGSESEGSAPAVEHSFPDLQTVNIVDGSTVNLADELGGGDTPVLLWFWAPH